MKRILIILLILFSTFAFAIGQNRTIKDVILNDSLSYFQKVALIEADSMEIYLNSDSGQQKRYRRMGAPMEYTFTKLLLTTNNWQPVNW